MVSLAYEYETRMEVRLDWATLKKGLETTRVETLTGLHSDGRLLTLIANIILQWK